MTCPLFTIVLDGIFRLKCDAVLKRVLFPDILNTKECVIGYGQGPAIPGAFQCIGKRKEIVEEGPLNRDRE